MSGQRPWNKHNINEAKGALSLALEYSGYLEGKAESCPDKDTAIDHINKAYHALRSLEKCLKEKA